MIGEALKLNPPGHVPGTCYSCKEACEVLVCSECSKRIRHDRDERLKQAEDTWRAERRVRELAAPLATIPRMHQWCRFDAPDLSKAVKRQGAIAEARAAVGSDRVVLMGVAGSGKTTLACAMLQQLVDEVREPGGDPKKYRDAVNARFASAYFIAKARFEHRLGDGEAAEVKEAIDATILVLDELGFDRAKNTALDEVIHERHAAERMTIITTGYSFEQLLEKYGDGVARRVFENAKVIRCDAVASRKAA